MLEQRKEYSVELYRQVGPDDGEWEEDYSSPSFMDAIHYAVEKKDKGWSVRVYDPYMQQVVDIA